MTGARELRKSRKDLREVPLTRELVDFLKSVEKAEDRKDFFTHTASSSKKEGCLYWGGNLFQILVSIFFLV